MQNHIKLAVLIFVLGLAGLVAAAGVYHVTRSDKGGRAQSPVAADTFGGPYTLVTHMGEEVTDQTFSGRYQLIYFGFTFCPAICPTELAKMTQALNGLGDKGEDITPLFISVDPERDTVEVMKGYVKLFHPRLIGLTGTVEQVEVVKKSYKVYAAKVEDPAMTEYTVDHSSYIYFMDPQGRLLSLFKTDDTADSMVKDMRKWLSGEGQS